MIVVAAVGLAAVVLPLLGLAIVFRHEIGTVLFGAAEPASGTRLVYEVPNLADGAPADIGKICRVLAERIDPRGRGGFVVRSAGQGRIEVLVPDGRDHAAEVERARRLASRRGVLEFRIVVDRVKDREQVDLDGIVRLREAGNSPDTPRFHWCRMHRGWELYQQGALDAWNFVYVPDAQTQTLDVLVDAGDGEDVTGVDLAGLGADTISGEPVITFRLKPGAEGRFSRLTRPEMRGRHMAIILDGVIQSAPVLRATLSSGGIIEGYKNNVRERDEILAALQAGDLGVDLGDPVVDEHFGPAAVLSPGGAPAGR
jgi:preprotein translocase subunit SecD